MKKSKAKVLLITVISAVLITALILTAVSLILTKGILKYYDIDIKAPTLLTSSTKLDNGTLMSSQSELAYFVNATPQGQTVTTVYNLQTGTVVFSHTKEATDPNAVTVTLGKVGTQPFFVTETRDAAAKVLASSLYNATGGSLAAASKDPEFVLYNNDVIAFNGNAYAVNEDGVLTKAFAIDDFSNITATANADAVGREYLYFINGQSFTVTDKQGNLVAAYTVRNYDVTAEQFTWNVLENGNVVFQYQFLLSDGAEEYDFTRTESGKVQKIDVVTELLKVSSNKVKDIDAEYVISAAGMQNLNTTPDLADHMVADFSKNLARINRFEDGLLAPSAELVVLDNGLDIDQTASDIVADAMMVGKVSEDWYIAVTSHGYLSIVDRHGSVEKTMSGMGLDMTSNYFITAKAIYNHEFEMVYDMAANGYEKERVTGDLILLKREVDGKTEYARYANGAVTVILSATATDTTYVESDVSGLYCIATVGNSATVYQYYNNQGASIGAFTAELTQLMEADNGAVLVRADGAYYRLNP